MMASWALLLYVSYLMFTLGLRSVVQWQQTGSPGFKGVSGTIGSSEWFGGVLLVLALVLGLLGPVVQMAGVLDPVAMLDGIVGHALGVVLYAAGLAGTLYAQFAMGTSWRVGVDERERTALVTGGPFAYVRNPIFAFMVVAASGLALLAPNLAALLGLCSLMVGLEIQVRLVEEPYLLSAHGQAYAAYAARAGRFVPGVGRLR